MPIGALSPLTLGTLPLVRGIYRGTFPAIGWTDLGGVTRTLYFARPLDRALASITLRDTSERYDGQNAVGSDFITTGIAAEYTLTGVARWIPQALVVSTWDGVQATGWDDALSGWALFLIAARDSAPLTWYPDRTQLGVSVACRWAGADDVKPEKDGIQRYRIDVSLVATVPFTGY